MVDERKVIFGIDIMPGSSPSSSKEAKYSLVILNDNRVIGEYENAPLRRIIRLAWEYRPSIIAVDNIFELGESEKDVAKIISLLPPTTSIVQVTASREGFEKLCEVAFKEGIYLESHPPPLKAAYISAILASRGRGLRIKAVEEKTKIIVAKGRSVGAGGSSQDRYKRRIRGIILRKTREIKDLLEREGLDYDLIVRRSESGLERSVFTVYASGDRVRELVKPLRSRDIKVLVRPIYSSRLEFESLAQEKRLPLIIVGIDPGIVTGIAVIDFDGKLILLKSGRELDRGDILSMISSIGKPAVIATDINPPPQSVMKLASTLKLPLFVPQKTLTTAEKQEVVLQYLSKIDGNISCDTHQRDALAAALKALRFYQSKLRQAEAYLDKVELDISIDSIRSMVINGISIAEAVEIEIDRKLREESEDRKVEDKVKEHKTTADISDRVKRKLVNLNRERAILRHRIKVLSSRVRELEKELEEVRRTFNAEVKAKREIEFLVDEVRKLREELREKENKIVELIDERKMMINILLRLVKGELSLAKVLDSLTQSSIAIADRMYGRISSEDIVFLKTTSFIQDNALQELARRDVLCVIGELFPEHVKKALEDSTIPVITIGEVEGYELIRIREGDLIFYSPEILHEARRRKIALRERREKKKMVDIAKIVDEYRSERLRELLRDTSDSSVIEFNEENM